MKHVLLVHNPGAGSKEYDKDKLVSLIEANGFKCRYSSTKKKGWNDFDHRFDFIVAAGGDGTVRKIVSELVNRKMLDKTWPIALLPLGTANNIGKTLGIMAKPEELIPTWKNGNFKSYDIGRISGIEESKFMMESFGFGIFPYLMMEMGKLERPESSSPEDEIKAALGLLESVVNSYEPRECELTVDGVDYSGKYMLAEVMNIRSIGPNLFLAPDADPGDGSYEIVLVPEEQKDEFRKYVHARLEGRETPYTYKTIKGRSVRMSWHGTHAHVDDKIVKIEKEEVVKLRLRDSLIRFMVP